MYCSHCGKPKVEQAGIARFNSDGKTLVYVADEHLMCAAADGSGVHELYANGDASRELLYPSVVGDWVYFGLFGPSPQLVRVPVAGGSAEVVS